MWSDAWSVIRLHVGRYAAGLPLAFAFLTGLAVALWMTPHGLERNATHEDYVDFFGTSAQLIGTLLVALVLEARLPFTRLGSVARGATASGTLLIAIGGIAAVLGMSPDLSAPVYDAAFAVTWGGLAGGFFTVALVGIHGVFIAFKDARKSHLEDMATKGDPVAAKKLKEEEGW